MSILASVVDQLGKWENIVTGRVADDIRIMVEDDRLAPKSLYKGFAA